MNIAENVISLTYAAGVIINSAMPRKKPADIRTLLLAYQKRRTKETGEEFTQAMMAGELGVTVAALYHWLQTPGTVGARTPRGLTREMLLLKLNANNGNAPAKA